MYKSIPLVKHLQPIHISLHFMFDILQLIHPSEFSKTNAICQFPKPEENTLIFSPPDLEDKEHTIYLSSEFAMKLP